MGTQFGSGKDFLRVSPNVLDRARAECALIDALSDFDLSTSQIREVLSLLDRMIAEKEVEIPLGL